ncbi:MAG: alpha/beta hydrolase family protein [Akkermansiaceae bacterium]
MIKTISPFFFILLSIACSAYPEVKHPPSAKTTSQLTEFSYLYEGKARMIPLKIYSPQNPSIKNAPVILLSHGLGGSREVGSYLGTFWAEHGFITVAMQHEGSDINIIKDKPYKDKIKALKSGMSIQSYLKRMHDVPATIDQLTKWNLDPSHPLYAKLNMQQLGMSGHSFGAITALSTSGQWNEAAGQRFTDKRIKAAFAMSPSTPRKNGKPNSDATKKAFSKVSTPWLLMTGTEDKVILTPHVTPASRMEVFQNLPKGDKYQLVLNKATHMAFSDRTLTGKNHRNPNHHEVIKTISLKFFQAYLTNDENAMHWLNSNKVETILEPKDTWQTK